jgi:glycosyltransferase involved in cell wall biosynthesis
MADPQRDLDKIEDVEKLSQSFIRTWYVDKEKANHIGVRMVDLFGQEKGLDYLEQNYPRTFSNLNFVKLDSPQRSYNIAVLCFSHPSDFRPRDVISGHKYSGSEEALIYLSMVLTEMNHRVVVYANVTPGHVESLKPHNPRFLPLKYFDTTTGDHDNEDPFDLVICWRMYDFARARKRANKVFLWLQDMPPERMDTTYLDGIFYLSKYQKELFSNKLEREVPHVIAGNGLNENYYSDNIALQVPRTKHSCFYGSNYGKGLKVLLEAWPNVLEKIPDAELHICFGRTNWNTITNEELNYIVSLIEKYPSVHEHGRLSNAEVAIKMMQCSIFSYPCTHPSATFEITCVQAQAAGCIPVVTWKYCLPEVIHPDAFFCDDIEDYSAILIKALLNEDRVDRKKFIDWGRAYTWDKVAKNWMELIEKHVPYKDNIIKDGPVGPDHL